MGWHVAQAEAVDGKPAAMWFGTFPPKLGVLFQAAWWHPMQSVFAAVKV
jgi:hypothetical protein